MVSELSDLVYFLFTTFAHTMTMLPIINKLKKISVISGLRYTSGPERSGGMLSSRPKKCRYAIPAHTVSLRAQRELKQACWEQVTLTTEPRLLLYYKRKIYIIMFSNRKCEHQPAAYACFWSESLQVLSAFYDWCLAGFHHLCLWRNPQLASVSTSHLLATSTDLEDS